MHGEDLVDAQLEPSLHLAHMLLVMIWDSSNGIHQLSESYDQLMLQNKIHDVASGSNITPSNKIHKLLVVYRFSNVMTSMFMSRKRWQNRDVFTSTMGFLSNTILLSCDK